MLCQLDTTAIDELPETELQFRVASRRSDFRSALGLVYRAYVRSSLTTPNPYKMRVTPHHLLPTTEVFLARVHQETVCTATLVRDGSQGLPMDVVYRNALAPLRSAGQKLAEVSCLADRRHSAGRAFPVLEKLMSLVAQAAKARQVDQLLIAVHPRHGRFYQRFLGFELVAGLVEHPSVRNRPAVALALDLNTLQTRSPRGYQRLFGSPFPTELLIPTPPSELARAELQLIARSCEQAAWRGEENSSPVSLSA